MAGQKKPQKNPGKKKAGGSGSSGEQALSSVIGSVLEEKGAIDAIIAAMGDGVSIQDTSCKILFQNQVSKEIYGDHVGEYCYRAYQDRDRVCERCHLTMTFADGEIHRLEQSRTTEAGQRYYEITASPLKDASGRIVAGIELVRDITERKQTEAEAEERNALVRQIMKSFHVGIGLLDREGRFTQLNRHMADLFGRTVEEMIGSHYSEHVDPSQQEESRQGVAALLSGAVPGADTDRLYRRGDGSSFWGHLTCYRLFDARGSLLGLIGTIDDITERKRAADALRESEAKLSLVLDNVGAYIFMKDRQYRYTYVNKKSADMFGKRPEDLLGRTDGEFFDPQSVEEIMRSDRTVIEEGKTVTREEVDLNVPDGEARTYWTVKLPLRDHAGAVIGLCGISTDITDRKKTEETKNRLLEAISASTDGISITDDKDRFIYVNDAHARIYGYPRQELLGKTWRDLAAPDLVPVIEQEFAKTLYDRTIGIWSGESPTSRRDGTVVPTEVTATARWDASGNYLGHICIVRDVTERMQAEEALWNSRNMLNQVLNTLPQSVFWKDRNSVYLGCNDVFARAVGLERPDQVAGKTDFDLPWPEAEAETYRADDHQVIASGQSKLHIMEPLQQADGSRLWIDTSKVPLVDMDGAVFGILGVYEDITERKKAEEKLQKSELNLRESQHVARLGSWDFDLATGALEWSEETYRLFDRSPADFIPSFDEFARLVHPEDLETMQTAFNAALASDADPYHVTVRIVNGSGRQWVMEAFGAVRRDHNGNALRILGTAQDVTERTRTDEKLRQSEQFIRGILDTVDEGFIVIGRDYRIMTANKAYCEQAGLPGDQVIGRHCYSLSHDIHRPCHEVGEECVVRKVLESGKPETVLHKHPGKDEHVQYVETKGFPVRDQAGHIVSVIETINNITERHLLEEERLRTQKLESIGTLAGGIAHDFNNLLQGVFGYISLAKLRYDDREKSQAALEQAEKALHQSVSLTTQLLTFSKGGKPAKKRMFLQPVIENAVKFALSGSRSEFQFAIDRDLWPVDGDAGQLSQVIQNIVLNADQAMPVGGRVAITARNVPAGASLPPGIGGGDLVELSIEDSGIGIPEQYLEKIFDPYFTTKEKGSGLGLATAYSIIKNHNGQIRVESEAGKGSTFFVYFPAASLTPESTAFLPSTPAGSVRPLRILAMDDEDIIRMLIEEMLRTLGHDVDIASRGEEAIEKYRASAATGRRFDAVILDYTIRGGMGGAETMRRLREIDPEVKGVVSSGYSDDDAVMNFRKHGFKAFLKKPYDIEELRKILQEVAGCAETGTGEMI